MQSGTITVTCSWPGLYGLGAHETEVAGSATVHPVLDPGVCPTLKARETRKRCTERPATLILTAGAAPSPELVWIAVFSVIFPTPNYLML